MVGERKLPTVTLMWGNTPLYDNRDSIPLLNYCLSRNIGILGIEGFIKLEDGTRMPKMDYIVDFSDFLKDQKVFVQKTIAISQDFISSAPDDILFEFVLYSFDEDETTSLALAALT